MKDRAKCNFSIFSAFLSDHLRKVKIHAGGGGEGDINYNAIIA